MKSYQQFLAELKRRRVFRMAALYGAVAFGLLEAADIAVPRLGLPDGAVTVLLVLVLLGFPVGLLLGWAYDVTPEGVRRTGPAQPGELEAIVALPARTRWTHGSLAMLGVAALLVGAWWAGRRTALTGDATPPPDAATAVGGRTLAVLPFVVQGSQDVAYLGDGIVSLLTTKLDGAGPLRSVDSRSVLRFVSEQGHEPGDPVAAVAVASTFGASLYVVGEIVEAAGRMQISARMHEASGAELAAATVDGTVDAVFDLVDHLTSELLGAMHGGPAARVQRIAAVTTSSVPALKAFFEGEELFRRGRFAEAMESFGRATRTDSLFALAFYRLSIAAEWNFADQTSLAAAETAVRLGERLPERERRILDAYLKRRLGQNEEAAATYRSLLGTYPDELEAWIDLSELYFHANPLNGRSFVESKATLGRVLDFDPRHSTALIHLIRIAAYERDVAAVESLTQRFLELDAEGDRNLEIEALRAIITQDRTALSRIVDGFSASSEAALTSVAWSAGLFGRDLEVARAASAALITPRNSPEAMELGYAQLAHLAAADGRPEDMETALTGLAGVSPVAALEHEAFLALLPFESTAPDQLRRLRDELQRSHPGRTSARENPSGMLTVDERLRRLNRFYLLGLLSARLGLAGDAVAYADSAAAVPLAPAHGSMAHDLALGVRAELLRGQGRIQDALATLQGNRRQISYAHTAATPVSGQVRERFLFAELLADVGQSDEARKWYETIDQLSLVELPYRRAAAERLARLNDP